jgi:hypothetical protein
VLSEGRIWPCATTALSESDEGSNGMFGTLVEKGEAKLGVYRSVC